MTLPVLVLVYYGSNVLIVTAQKARGTRAYAVRKNKRPNARHAWLSIRGGGSNSTLFSYELLRPFLAAK